MFSNCLIKSSSAWYCFLLQYGAVITKEKMLHLPFDSWRFAYVWFSDRFWSLNHEKTSGHLIILLSLSLIGWGNSRGQTGSLISGDTSVNLVSLRASIAIFLYGHWDQLTPLLTLTTAVNCPSTLIFCSYFHPHISEQSDFKNKIWSWFPPKTLFFENRSLFVFQFSS